MSMLIKINVNETTHHPGIFRGNAPQTSLLGLIMRDFTSFPHRFFLGPIKN